MTINEAVKILRRTMKWRKNFIFIHQKQAEVSKNKCIRRHLKEHIKESKQEIAAIKRVLYFIKIVTR